MQTSRNAGKRTYHTCDKTPRNKRQYRKRSNDQEQNGKEYIAEVHNKWAPFSGPSFQKHALWKRSAPEHAIENHATQQYTLQKHATQQHAAWVLQAQKNRGSQRTDDPGST